MVPSRGLKETRVPKVPLREKGGPKVLWREKGVETNSYADVVESKPGRMGHSIWLELGEREVRGRLNQMKQCGGLVRWWGNNTAPLPELDFVRRRMHQHWLLKGKFSVVVLGRGLLLFEFESLSEAERVLAKAKGVSRRTFLFWIDGT